MGKKVFLAKSDPVETVDEHTNNLLLNWEKLKLIYPDATKNWDLLWHACKYHDLGKLHPGFQNIIRNRFDDCDELSNIKIVHAMYSLLFIDCKKLKEKFTDEEIESLVYAVAFHHDRKIDSSIELVKDINLQKLFFEYLKNNYDGFENYKLDKFTFPSRRYNNNRYRGENIEMDDAYYEHVKLKGLLHKLDYTASAHEIPEYENDFLCKVLDTKISNWKKDNPKSNWNDAQRFMIEHRDDNVILKAQTGLGKTEAGLLWIADNKGFFTLPLRSSINAIYSRIYDDCKNAIVDIKNMDNKVTILHSSALDELLTRDIEDISIESDAFESISKKYSKTRLFSFPLTITTIYQLFDFVLKYRGYEYKYAILSYSKILIDEIQMYNSDVLAYLLSGIKMISDIGGKFAVVTATFPSFIRKELKKLDVKFIESPAFCKNELRHSIKVKKQNKILAEDVICASYQRDKVLVICNTVKSAMDIYKKMSESDYEGNLNLIHSRFINMDRNEKDNKILEFSNNSERGIWIGTQVLEVSLDIDFDVLFTELSDINGFFQRLGRVYRKRQFIPRDDFMYNVYLYIGDEQNIFIAGVGYVVDKDIFNISRRAFLDFDGKLTEQEKMDIVESEYSYNNIRNTNYYKDYINSMSYIESRFNNELSAKQAQKIFNNIASYNVIPESVYRSHKDDIDECINKFSVNESGKYRFSKEDRSKSRIELKKYVLSIPDYLYKNLIRQNCIRKYSLSDYETLIFAEGAYDFDIGFEITTQDDKQKDDIDERMF